MSRMTQQRRLGSTARGPATQGLSSRASAHSRETRDPELGVLYVAQGATLAYWREAR